MNEITEAPKTSRSLQSFLLKVSKRVAAYKVPSDSKHLEYKAGFGKFIYPSEPIENKIGWIQPDFEFFDTVTALLPDKVGIEECRSIIETMSKHLEKQGIFVYISEPSDNDVRGKKIKVKTKDGEVEIEGLTQRDFADHRHFVKAYHFGVSKDDEGKKTIHYNFTEPDNTGTSIILINEKRLQKDPLYALISLAHEVGHSAEQRRVLGTKLQDTKVGLQQGDIADYIVPGTEVIACIFGAKMAYLLWEKTGDEGCVEGGAKQIARYSHVLSIAPQSPNS